MTAEPTHYVRTKDAQDAVKGHEGEIARAVGIAWRDGQKTHIDCPYPNHGGESDWRLNSKGRAICTCTNGKTDSPFDVVAKVEGLDFEASKIRCMEIIGRADLIREKSGSSGGQATDAESLMRAPAERRDDSLPRAYLAHRLGTPADAVPMPATPTVGLRALGYFDPPKGKGTGKPVHVGDYPCIVWGQLDAEGRQHAHRIYVAPGGAGKAELGLVANGTVRDPKKSAKRTGEESTAGRAVIWGDARRAPWGIIAEGIETAAAVAYAFRQEIETGAAYVAAGVNANGIEAFIPWPETKRVTIAADRDEAVKISTPNPSRRGEQAARRFGIRRHETVAVACALAGEPGSATDWLDVHCARGSEAVRAGILAAVAYSLASGVGKSRMTADAQLRASHTWSTFIILSAEKSLEEKVRGDGGEWYGGMAARIPDIDVTNVDRAVDQAVMARIQACDQHFGHAGPAFVREIVARGLHLRAEEIRQGINQTADALAGHGADSAMRRAALPRISRRRMGAHPQPRPRFPRRIRRPGRSPWLDRLPPVWGSPCRWYRPC